MGNVVKVCIELEFNKQQMLIILYCIAFGVQGQFTVELTITSYRINHCVKYRENKALQQFMYPSQ